MVDAISSFIPTTNTHPSQAEAHPGGAREWACADNGDGGGALIHRDHILCPVPEYKDHLGRDRGWGTGRDSREERMQALLVLKNPKKAASLTTA